MLQVASKHREAVGTGSLDQALSDPLGRLAFGVIKQAVDDYTKGRKPVESDEQKERSKWGKREWRRDVRELKRETQSARDFIYGPGLEVWVRVGQLESYANLDVWRRLAETSNVRVFNNRHLKR